MTRPTGNIWQLENLETRQMLSATVGIAPLLAGDTAVFARATRTPKIVGTWKGTITNDSIHATFGFTLDFTKQTHTGALKGTATTEGVGEGTLTGKITGDSFTLRIVGNAKGTVTTASGTYSVSKRRGKTLTGTWSDVAGTGTFTVSLV